MAKKIVQMYDKYQSTTRVYPKIIKDCLQEDVTDYIEGQVEANPTLAGTEASLTGLQVGDTKYKVEQPINVVANPTLAGTEGNLEGLQVGDTKYKVGGGSQLYRNRITLSSCSWYVSSEYKTGHLTLDLICEVLITSKNDLTNYLNNLTSYEGCFGILTSGSYTSYPLYVRAIKKGTTAEHIGVIVDGMGAGNYSEFEFNNIDYEYATLKTVYNKTL